MVAPTDTADPVSGFNEFVTRLLCRAIGRDEGAIQRVYDRWATDDSGRSFLDHMVDRAVLDRVTAKAILLAWSGGLDARDARQVVDASKLRAAVTRGEPAPDPIPTDHSVEYRAIGSRLGRYPVKGVLGRGGFGPVYLSVHPSLRVPVAIKTLAGGAAVRPTLDAEARRQATISHPNVVRVWDYEGGADPFLVLEYVPGENLRDRLAAGPLDRTDGFLLLVQAAAGLRAALRTGVTHGDVKPANLLTARENGFKLGDFGLARCRDRFARSVPLEEPRLRPQITGTWVYAAPERFEGAGDHRADVYSLGHTVYHALAGRPAVAGHDPDQIMLGHKRGDWPPLHLAAPGVGWAVSDLVARMTATDPDRRFDSYDDLIWSAEAAFGMRLETY